MKRSETLGGLVEGFESFLKGGERKYSTPTTRGYKSDVEELLVFLDSIERTFDRCSTEDVARYFSGRNIRESTLRRKVSAFKKFAGYCEREVSDGFLDVNRILEVARVRSPIRINYASDEDFQRLIASIRDKPIENFLGKYFKSRDIVAATFLFGGKINAKRISNLDLKDVHYISGGVSVDTVGSGRTPEEVSVEIPFSNVYGELRGYQEVRRKFLESRDIWREEAFALNRDGGRISERSLRRKIGECLKIAGMDERFNVASFCRKIGED